MAGGREVVYQTGHERRLGSDDREVYAVLPDGCEDGGVIAWVDCQVGAELGRSRVARRAVDGGGAGQRPAERVLPSASADYEYLHYFLPLNASVNADAAFFAASVICDTVCLASSA